MAIGSEEQAVIVHSALPIAGTDELFEQIAALESQLESTISAAGVGEFDGNEIGQDELVLYMYGPDAEMLFSVVAPVLRRTQLTQDAIASVRFGPPGALLRTVRLSAH